MTNRRRHILTCLQLHKTMFSTKKNSWLKTNLMLALALFPLLTFPHYLKMNVHNMLAWRRSASCLSGDSDTGGKLQKIISVLSRNIHLATD